jgi:hypothetical protein
MIAAIAATTAAIAEIRAALLALRAKLICSAFRQAKRAASLSSTISSTCFRLSYGMTGLLEALTILVAAFAGARLAFKFEERR